MHPVLSFRKWILHGLVSWLRLAAAHPPFSSIVGRPRHQGVMVGMGQKDSYVG